MIKGFETETAPLNEYEKTLLPLFIQGFSTKLGKNNAITNKEVCLKMKYLGHDVNDTRIRKIVNHIRNNNLVSVLLASSKGYWVSKDKKEITDWIESMEGRISSMAVVKNAVKSQLTDMMSNQQGISFEQEIHCSCDGESHLDICLTCGLEKDLWISLKK